MNTFLSEIGKQLAQRWAVLLALPGLMYITVGLAAHTLGKDHPFDLVLLGTQISSWAANPALHSFGTGVLIALVMLVGSIGAGLAAALLGWINQLFWALPGHRPPASWIANWRRTRSRAAKRAADEARTPELARLAIARADRICLIEADRPSWIGDRLRACRVRVEHSYGLDLDTVWPRIWLLLPDSARSEVTSARDKLTGSARLGGWAVLYLALTWWWWPALIIGLITSMAAAVRARQATLVYVQLVEAVVDLYGHELAAKIGLTAESGAITAELGTKITALLKKSRWDPESSLAD